MSARTDRLVTLILSGLAALTIVLGMIGYYFAPLDGPADGLNTTGGFGRFFDRLYLSLQLLVGGATDVKEEPILLVARWFGALFAASVVVKLLAPHVGERIDRCRIRHWSNHSVVIGVGEKGSTLLQHLCPRTQVVAVDLREFDESLAGATTFDKRLRKLIRKRVIPLRGDGNGQTLQRAANLRTAERVYVVTPDDALNVEIAKRIDEWFSPHRRKPLLLLVHVKEPRLGSELLSRVDAWTCAVRFFHLPQVAARVLHSRWPLAIKAREQGADRMNLVFIGFDRYAEGLLIHVLRLGPIGDQRAPFVTVFAPDAQAVKERIDANYASLETCVDRFEAIPHDLDVDLSQQDLARAESTLSPVTAVFVFGRDDTDSFHLAHRVRHVTNRADMWRAPVFVRLHRPAAFDHSLTRLSRRLEQETEGMLDKAREERTSARSTERKKKRLSDVIEPFGELQEICDPEAFWDWHEQLAYRLHEGYRADASRLPVSGRLSPAEQAWSRLREDLRESNRRAVDHISLKLATIGRIVVHRLPLLGAPFAEASAGDGPNADVLAAARLEHECWAREKRLAGWRLGTPRDDRLQIHPDLADFDHLDEPARNKDVDQVLLIQRLLLESKGEQVPDELERCRQRFGATVFRERVIGLAGHTSLPAEAGALIEQGVEALTRQAEARLGSAGDEFWTFVTALAPGADCVLLNEFSHQLERKYKGRHRLIVVRGLPSFQLARASVHKIGNVWEANGLGRPRLAAKEGNVDAAADEIAKYLENTISEVAAVDMVIEVGPARPVSSPPSVPDAVTMRLGLEASNKYLIDRCDDLVVVLDPGRYQQPDFIALRWRELSADAFPPHGTGALVHGWLNRVRPSAPGRLDPLHPGGLHLIDIRPGHARTTEKQPSS